MSTTSPQRPQLNSPITFAPSANTHRRLHSSASTDDDYEFDSEHSSTPVAATRQSPYATRRGAATPTSQLSPYPNVSTPTTATAAVLHGLRPVHNEHSSIGTRQQQNAAPVSTPSDQKQNSPWQPGHRPRQHSQGFFEPSLPSASTMNANQQASGTMASGLTTSQLAAQAAMHAQSAQQHSRKRSQTLPDPAQQPGGGQPPPRYPLQTERSFNAIFLPRFDVLMAIFSRLSLESVNAGVPSPRIDQGSPLPAPPPLPNSRPGTASSNDVALNSLTSPASYPSSSGPGLDSSSGASPFSLLGSASRSRATSNTSVGSWHSGPSYGVPGHLTPLQPTISTSSAPQAPFPNGSASLQHPNSLPNHNAFAMYAQQQSILDTGARLTEMVGRMLQCVSVLASVQSGDEKQEMMERLTKTLKWNWLGRGRTGRQRRGFVGTKLRTGTTGSSATGEVPREVEVGG